MKTVLIMAPVLIIIMLIFFRIIHFYFEFVSFIFLIVILIIIPLVGYYFSLRIKRKWLMIFLKIFFILWTPILIGISVYILMKPACCKGRASTIKGTVSSLRSESDLYFNNSNQSYSGLCEYKNIKKSFELLKNIDKEIKISCFVTTDKYAIAVDSKELLDAKNWCIDSMGNSGSVTTEEFEKISKNYLCK